MKNITIILSIFMLLTTSQASDLEKEARWKEQVVGDLFDGEPIDLNDGKHDFLGLLINEDNSEKRAIVVLHGAGIHPDWPQVINPVRVQLAEQGWSTLSIQLPVLDNTAESSDYAPLIIEAAPRIQAAVDYLISEGNTDIYIIAHSLGATMASYYLSQTEQKIDGFIGIGMSSRTLPYLSQITIPVMDMYGSQDEVPTVVASAQDRAEASKNNDSYSQKVVENGNHFLDEKVDTLISNIVAWLATTKQ